MKTLWIMRHAKSDQADGSLADIDRPLNRRGDRDAPELGRWMKKHGGPPQLVACSPALRARQTAELVVRGCGYPGSPVVWEHLYPGSPDSTLQALRGLDDGLDHVLLVGHNPHCEDLVSALTAGGRLALRLPTATVALIACPCDRWGDLAWGDARLEGLVSPKTL